MIRRLNYTGRVKINRADVRLSTSDVSGQLSFKAALHLTDYELPAEALVFVEAYRQTTWMRFQFGTVAALQAPADCGLHEFDSPEGILFRVKVTQAHDEHILLAAADQIPLALPDEGDADRESLLEFVPAELGDEMWQVELEAEPRLLVNKSAVPDCRQLALSPVFVALVYPAVLRQILINVLIEHEHRDTDDDTDWRSKWLRFAALLPGMDPEPPEKDDDEAARRWADDAVAAFTTKLALREKFAVAWEPAEGV
jgi:hypothetical protein